jgi:hypothetical protein
MDFRFWRLWGLYRLLLYLPFAVVTLIPAAWNLCEGRAIRDVNQHKRGYAPKTVMPLVLRVTESDNVTVVATWHIWFFGEVVDLPWSRKYRETQGVLMTVRPLIIIQEEPEQNLVLPTRIR